MRAAPWCPWGHPSLQNCRQSRVQGDHSLGFWDSYEQIFGNRRIFRSQLSSTAVGRQSLLSLTLELQGKAEVVVGISVFRSDSDGLADFGDRLNQLTLVPQGEPRLL